MACSLQVRTGKETNCGTDHAFCSRLNVEAVKRGLNQQMIGYMLADFMHTVSR